MQTGQFGRAVEDGGQHGCEIYSFHQTSSASAQTAPSLAMRLECQTGAHARSWCPTPSGIPNATRSPSAADRKEPSRPTKLPRTSRDSRPPSSDRTQRTSSRAPEAAPPRAQVAGRRPAPPVGHRRLPVQILARRPTDERDRKELVELNRRRDWQDRVRAHDQDAVHASRFKGLPEGRLQQQGIQSALHQRLRTAAPKLGVYNRRDDALRGQELDVLQAVTQDALDISRVPLGMHDVQSPLLPRGRERGPAGRAVRPVEPPHDSKLYDHDCIFGLPESGDLRPAAGVGKVVHVDAPGSHRNHPPHRQQGSVKGRRPALLGGDQHDLGAGGRDVRALRISEGHNGRHLHGIGRGGVLRQGMRGSEPHAVVAAP
eukprot:scaffold7024_cov229-Pinguiococcus_pyrenoidosus.AAC.2